MINLIQNAIKFSNRGQTIKISVDFYSAQDQLNFIGVNFRVSDKGIGISKEDRKNLFKMNFQATSEISKQKNKHGHGIGLYMCQNIARALGGNLFLNDEVTQGSEFVFSIILEKKVVKPNYRIKKKIKVKTQKLKTKNLLSTLVEVVGEESSSEQDDLEVPDEVSDEIKPLVLIAED